MTKLASPNVQSLPANEQLPAPAQQRLIVVGVRDVEHDRDTIDWAVSEAVPDVDTVYVAVGGGGLIGGIGGYLKAAKPAVEVVGCWPENSPVMYECMRAGRVVDVPERPTLSESTAGGLEPGSVTLDVCRHVIDRASFVPSVLK